MPTSRSDRQRPPKGHRAVLSHLVAGGLIQQDESGLAWVSPTRSADHYFTNEAVAYLRERGFSHFDYDDHQRHRYVVAESKYPGKLEAKMDLNPPPKRVRKRKTKEPANG